MSHKLKEWCSLAGNRVVYVNRAGNSNRVKTRYDQPIFHLIGGVDHAIRAHFLSVRLCSPHCVDAADCSVLARRQARSRSAKAAQTQTGTQAVCRIYLQTRVRTL